jgi:hypothetical protein
MAYLDPDRLQGLAARVLAEDAPATVISVTRGMPRLIDQTL